MANVVLSQEQLADIREKYDPAPGSQLDKALKTAEQKLLELAALRERQSHYYSIGSRADGFMSRLANYGVDMRQDDLFDQVTAAQSAQLAVAAIDAPLRTLVQQTQDEYNTASGRVNNVARFLVDAGQSRDKKKLPWAMAKYCGTEAPPAGVVERVRERVLG